MMVRSTGNRRIGKGGCTGVYCSSRSKYEELCLQGQEQSRDYLWAGHLGSGWHGLWLSSGSLLELVSRTH